MSAEFDLTFVGAQLQLWISFFTTKAFTICLGGVVSWCFCFFCYMLLCCVKQRLNLGYPAVSMPLKSKGTCSGVEAFHLKRFFYLFLFLRGALTR
uniref:Uncharacterized protein n=1 Tax=Salix viminalis TaxID=40686 RepID=A0A6N2N045_SALVM